MCTELALDMAVMDGLVSFTQHPAVFTGKINKKEGLKKYIVRYDFG